MAQISRVGFGQVEPNHLTGIVDGSIYAQLPAAAALGNVLENGRFAKYDMVAGAVNLTGAGPWMMIYNEEKLYDERYQNHKDFAMVKSTKVSKNVGIGNLKYRTRGYLDLVPRLIEINVGDIFTTNTFGAATTNESAVAGEAVALDTTVYIGANGYLTATAPENYAGPQFKCVKVYTMADGQPGVKLQRIA